MKTQRLCLSSGRELSYSTAGDPDAPLQMLVTNLDWSDYVGRIADRTN